jgi:hypothetical protein
MSKIKHELEEPKGAGGGLGIRSSFRDVILWPSKHMNRSNAGQISVSMPHSVHPNRVFDVGITLWVSDISVPPPAQQWAHKDNCSPRWTNTSVVAMEIWKETDS